MPLASILLCALVAGVPKATSHKKATPSSSKTTKSSAKSKKLAPVKKNKGPAKAMKIQPTTKVLASRSAMSSARGQGTAVLTGFLLRYANGSKPLTGLDNAVTRKLDGLPGGRAAAKRIAARIQKLSPQQLKGSLGHNSSRVNKPGRRRDVSNAARAAKVAGWTPGLSLMLPTTTLPGEYVAPKVDEFKIFLSGVACHKASDTDTNGDEVVVVTKVFKHGSSTSQDTVLPTQGTLGALTPGEARPIDNVAIVKGSAWDRLILTAVFEDDGGDSTQAREELDVLLALAESVADGTNIADIEASIEFALGILELSNPAVVPSVKLTTIKWSQLNDLYKTEPETIGDVEWKLQAVHETDGGQYTIYFTTPQMPPPAKLTNVRLMLYRLKAFETVPPKSYLELVFDFKDESKGLAFPVGKANHAINQRFQMLVKRGDVEFEFRAYISRPGPSQGWRRIKRSNGRTDRVRCGVNRAIKCKPIRKQLDISPQSGDHLTAKYRPTRGWIMGNVQARSGEAVTATGTGAPKGQIVFTVDHEK